MTGALERQMENEVSKELKIRQRALEVSEVNLKYWKRHFCEDFKTCFLKNGRKFKNSSKAFFRI